jgi:uncharacterized membrane protein YoaK (UPF0700 family)
MDHLAEAHARLETAAIGRTIGNVQEVMGMEPPFRLPREEAFLYGTGLGFVAGFMDVFGFMRLFGLLAAHVTGNLVFTAIEIARGGSEIAVKLAALPMFCLGVAFAAFIVEKRRISGRDPVRPLLLMQTAILAAAIPLGLAMPPPTGPDHPTVMVIGGIMLFAMAIQNAVMRLVLVKVPQTTVMTGNITQAISDTVALGGGFVSTADRQRDETSVRHRSALLTAIVVAFTLGGIGGGIGHLHVGYPSMLLPLALLAGLAAMRRPAPAVA